MTEIAWPLLFAHVEAEESPIGVGGFQTLAYARDGLSAADVAEIEPRLLFTTADDVSAKHLYFTTKRGLTVVARLAPIPAPDRAGRGGRYLAHALVLPPNHAEDPVRLCAGYPFFTTIDPLLAAAHGALGAVPLPPLPPAPATELSPPLLITLVLAALQAAALRRAARMVALVGEASTVLEAFAALWPLLPRACWAACAFDTDFRGGNPVATPYWAVGLPTPPAHPRYITLHLARGTCDDSLTPDTPYAWLAAQAIAAAQAPLLATHCEAAYARCAGTSHPALPDELEALLG